MMRTAWYQLFWVGFSSFDFSTASYQSELKGLLNNLKNLNICKNFAYNISSTFKHEGKFTGVVPIGDTIIQVAIGYKASTSLRFKKKALALAFIGISLLDTKRTFYCHMWKKFTNSNDFLSQLFICNTCIMFQRSKVNILIREDKYKITWKREERWHCKLRQKEFRMLATEEWALPYTATRSTFTNFTVTASHPNQTIHDGANVITTTVGGCLSMMGVIFITVSYFKLVEYRAGGTTAQTILLYISFGSYCFSIYSSFDDWTTGNNNSLCTV